MMTKAMSMKKRIVKSKIRMKTVSKPKKWEEKVKGSSSDDSPSPPPGKEREEDCGYHHKEPCWSQQEQARKSRGEFVWYIQAA